MYKEFKYLFSDLLKNGVFIYLYNYFFCLIDVVIDIVNIDRLKKKWDEIKVLVYLDKFFWLRRL